jgi:hypothetical protein
MSDGFQVVMSELLSASGVFERESGTLMGAVPGGGPQAPDGGDGVINAAMSDVLRAAALTTGQLAAVIDSHSQKLRTAYDRYHSADESSTQLAQQLTSLLR